MSYPPPPGLKSSTPAPPHNLPARPPPSAVAPSYKAGNGAAKPAYAAFAPRAVASTTDARTGITPQYPGVTNTTYGGVSSYPQTSQNYGSQPPESYHTSTPQIQNPFVPISTSSGPSPYGAASSFDPDYEAQVQQWQSAYMSKEDRPTNIAKSAVPVAGPAIAASSTALESTAQKTVKRSGGGTEWTDSSLLEWDPAHFRLFIGNLAGEVTDESLLKAFSRYTSVQKARVIRDKRTTKSKGYGFVSFSDGDDYFSAAKEMNGKYIGSHPVTITKAKTEVRPALIRNDKDKRGKKGTGGHGKVSHDGVSKKAPKTKGGLRVLG